MMENKKLNEFKRPPIKIVMQSSQKSSERKMLQLSVPPMQE